MEETKQLNKRFLNLSETSIYLNLGRNKTMEFCEKIKAKRKIGRRVVYDKFVIDAYFDQITLEDGDFNGK